MKKIVLLAFVVSTLAIGCKKSNPTVCYSSINRVYNTGQYQYTEIDTTDCLTPPKPNPGYGYTVNDTTVIWANGDTIRFFPRK
jgi:hypothetical protein